MRHFARRFHASQKMYVMQFATCRKGRNRVRLPEMRVRDQEMFPLPGTEYPLCLSKVRVYGAVNHGDRCSHSQGHAGIA